MLEAGQALLHYRLVDKIGEGGMGLVWRATDTSLDRQVAIKVLPDSFARDAERLARFEREARLLASMNHANIAVVYGLHEVDGVRFIAMELVDGEDLAQRIQRGPLPLETALGIASQVAEALEAAHEKGVIHRDLKPANILLTRDGKAKVLDFGLAKSLVPDGGSGDPEHSPTVTSLGSVAGVVLGTAAYMSPDQARGAVVDARTDVWALGCVLYEMLTGRRAFGGDTVSDTLASILAREPDWELLPSTTPPAIRVMLRRFLDKDVNRRPRDVGIARIEIDDVLAGRTPIEPPAVAGRAPASASNRRPLAIVAPVAIVATAIGLLVGWWLKPGTAPPPERPAMRSAIEVPAGVRPGVLSLTRDGGTLLMAGTIDRGDRIVMRRMNTGEYGYLSGTADAEHVFTSPDGEWVGFFADGKLKKTRLDGGSPVVICDAPDARGGTWDTDGTIYFTPFYTSGIWSVPAAGGSPVERTHPDPARRELSHRWPTVVPEARILLFTIELPGSFDNAKVAALSLEDGTTKVLVENATFGRYAASGHLLFDREQTLYAVPFDPRAVAVRGTPVPVLTEVTDEPTSGWASYDVSPDGLLAYVPATAANNSTVMRVDRDGNRAPLIELRGPFDNVRPSPDGKRLAMSQSGRDVWVYDLERGTMTRLTLDAAADWFTEWTPDGKRIVFSSSRDGAFNLYWRRADGSGEAERLTESENDHIPFSWTADGRTLAYTDLNAEKGFDVWVLELGDSIATRPFLDSRYDERAPAFSPDGRWIAYSSDESGQAEVYVRPYPGPGGRWQVSTHGGDYPAWSPTGDELYYLAEDGLMAVPVRVDPEFRAATPTRIADRPTLGDATFLFGFSLTPDGRGFLYVERGATPIPIQLVSNWFTELRGAAPAAR